MPRWSHPLDALLAARGLLFPWLAVCLGLGIGGYFALPREPTGREWAGLALAWAAAVAIWRLAGARWQAPALGLAALLAGALAAGARAHLVAAPVLGHPYYGAVQGRIVAIDRAASGKLRLVLDQVVLDGPDRGATPARVRIALSDPPRHLSPLPGQVVLLTAHLLPPQGPAEPGGFDFRRLAWFRQLGAVGDTRVPVLLWAPAGRGLLSGGWLARQRLGLAAAIRARIPGDPGAFAAAVATGDRSGIGAQAVTDLRAANLAHLLAISGLHMGLLVGFVFAVLRYGLTLVPPLTLRLPVKKIAAAGALLAATAYLALSGGNIATQRAFVMVAVMLGAVLADRQALTLRAVAIAACLLLLTRPESLLSPGFQMSFAATTALVAAFGALRGLLSAVPRVPRTVLAMALSSAVAGLATAPIAAATFGRVAEYGLPANLLAVPAMGLIVMPAAVAAALLAPLGLAGPALWLMGRGAAWVLAVAAWVAGLPGAVLPVKQPGAVVLPLLALAGLWLVLWRGWPRWLGPPAMAAALLLWSQAGRPLLLVAADGGLVGLMTPAGRVLSKPSGAGFVARSWLQADGDGASQGAAAARPGLSGPPGRRRFRLAGLPVAQLTGRGAAEAFDAACAQARLVILSVEAPDRPAPVPRRAAHPAAIPSVRPGQGEATAGRCRVIDPRLLRRSGGLALSVAAGTLTFTSAAQLAGRRLWTPAMRQGSGSTAALAPLRLPGRERGPPRDGPAAQ
ncbi:ComEC/Rec2 family competence protein [Acidimangrovimonas pyrenivorans]|uniref:ComEC/Rec2 family competence protein n=1 Tax=Acidimangrovimonas pyrenivorans TaxID=2030798 RepID=A0ABV7ACX4_9RHOB